MAPSLNVRHARPISWLSTAECTAGCPRSAVHRRAAERAAKHAVPALYAMRAEPVRVAVTTRCAWCDVRGAHVWSAVHALHAVPVSADLTVRCAWSAIRRSFRAAERSAEHAVPALHAAFERRGVRDGQTCQVGSLLQFLL